MQATNDMEHIKVLIVEDNDANRQTLADQLRSRGYHVFIASDGLEAEDVARRIIPDVILMDMRLAKRDGWETTKVLRGFPELANTKIIALTANAMPEDKERCLSAGCDEYVAKPYTIEDLVSKLTLSERRSSSTNHIMESQDIASLVHDIRAELQNLHEGLFSPASAQKSRNQIEDLAKKYSEILTLLKNINHNLVRYNKDSSTTQSQPSYKPPTSGSDSAADNTLAEDTYSILVIENDERQAQRLTQLLNAAFYNATYVTSSDSALALLRMQSFDAYIVDIQLPPFDGIELVNRSDGKMNPSANVIFLSISPDIYIDRLTQLGATRVLSKHSSNPADVLSAVNEVLPSRNAGLAALSDIDDAGEKLLNALTHPNKALLSRELRYEQSRIGDEIVGQFLHQVVPILESSSSSNLAVAASYLADAQELAAKLRISPLSHRLYREEKRMKERMYYKKGSYGLGIIYSIWRLTSSYGQSIAKWATCSAAIIAFFAILYFPDFGVTTFVVGDSSMVSRTLFDKICYAIFLSFANLCLFGVESIAPQDSFTRLLVLLQSIMGLVMIGILVSMITPKIMGEHEH